MNITFHRDVNKPLRLYLLPKAMLHPEIQDELGKYTAGQHEIEIGWNPIVNHFLSVYFDGDCSTDRLDIEL